MARGSKVITAIAASSAGLILVLTACGVIVADEDEPAPASDAGGAVRLGDATVDQAVCIDAPGEPEICNGIDDDCNGKVDEGCPKDILVGPASTRSPTYGISDGGGPYDDTCPPGEVLVGLSTVTYSWLVQIGGICGKVAVVAATDTTPYTYRVEVTRGTEMPNRGTYGGTAGSLVCPDGGVVVGVSGKAGLYIDNLALRCASVALTGDAGSYGLAIKPSAQIGPVGGDGGGAFAPFSCPDGGTVARMVGRHGFYVDRLAFACAKPAVTVR